MTYTDAMKKRAEELQAQWQSREQIKNTLSIEKQMWYFGQKQTTPALNQTPPTPEIKLTQPPKLDWMKRLQEQNKHIIEAQKTQQTPTPQPVQPQTQPITQEALYKWTKPVQSMWMFQEWLNMIQQQGQTQQNQIMKQYQDDIATIRLEEDQVKSQYKNADEVLWRIRNVENAYKQGIMDPQQIAQTTGMSLDQVNQVIRGEAFKSLQLQDRVAPEARRDLEYQMNELQTSKWRQVDDLAVQAERSKYNYENQVEDILRQAGLQEARMTKMGALTWAIQSSWYRLAIDLMKQDTMRQLDRLRTVQGREQDDIKKARTRLLEDFETNTVKIKDYFDRGMNTLRANAMAQIQTINQKYGVASQNTVKALEQLYNSMEQQKVTLLNQTMSLQNSFNDMRKQEIDAMQKMSEWGYQNYLDMYKVNPAMANAMYPEMANQIERNTAIQKYGDSPAVRNFNPGNITDLWFWGKRVEWERFTVFNSPMEWFNALLQKVQYNQTNPASDYYGMNLLQYFAKYAPASDGNDPVSYANTVAWWLKVSPNTKISELDPVKFASAIARKENNSSYQMLLDLWIITPERTLWTSPQWLMPWAWGAWAWTQLSPEAMGIIDWIAKLTDLPSADRTRVLAEIKTSWQQILTQKVVNQSKLVIDKIQQIKNSDWYKQAVWRTISKRWWLAGDKDESWQTIPIAWTDAYDTYQMIQQLKMLVGIPYLENMKWLWSMSEREFWSMMSASTALNANMTKDWFEKELNNIIEASQSIITRNGEPQYVPTWWTQPAYYNPVDQWFVLPPKQ